MDIFEEEKLHLEESVDSMNKEIEIIKDNMNSLNKEGTSLSYEDRKRGTHLVINAKFDDAAENLGKITRALPSPYFGRIDYSRNRSTCSSKIYIGKSGITAEKRTIVTDWRAPICSLYYDSEVGEVEIDSPNGKVPAHLNLKRQINIQNGELLDVQDTSLVTNDDLLKPYLNTNADNKMKIIIASIQKEQNDIIRRNSKEDIIVQGVAGSGKTSVALHRIAYLIYELGSKISSEDFLVLGPNDYFLNYISSILPELETSPVDQKTLLKFTNDYLDIKTKLKLKEDNYKCNSSEDLLNKNIEKYKASLEYKNDIDRYFEDYFATKLITEDFKIGGEVIFTIDQVKEILFTGKKNPDYDRTKIYLLNKFKNEKSMIYDRLNKKYRDIYTKLPKEDPARKEAVDKSFELYNLIYKEGEKLFKNYMKRIQVSPIELYKVFIDNIKSLNTNLNKEEQKLLKKNTLSDLRKKTISFVDIPALLHINYLYTGKNIKYKYVVIDEAQDYGLFHFDALKEIAKGSNFSIYGDLAQSIYSYRSVDSWNEVHEKVFNNNSNLINLNKSYRTTIEITENANKVLGYMNLSNAEPVIRHGVDVSYSDKTNDINYKIQKISDWVEQGYKSIAVICKTNQEAKKVNKELNENGIPSKYLSAKDEEYTGGIFVLTSAAAKGLEFDTVIVNDASDNVYKEDSDVDMHLLYVASTRALHEQVILYNKHLTKPYNGLENIKEKDNEKNQLKMLRKN